MDFLAPRRAVRRRKYALERDESQTAAFKRWRSKWLRSHMPAVFVHWKFNLWVPALGDCFCTSLATLYLRQTINGIRPLIASYIVYEGVRDWSQIKSKLKPFMKTTHNSVFRPLVPKALKKFLWFHRPGAILPTQGGGNFKTHYRTFGISCRNSL